MGILGKDCGIPDDRMYRIGLPLGIFGYRDFTSKFTNREQYVIAAINDDPKISDEERIEKLRPFFAKIDMNLIWRPEE